MLLFLLLFILLSAAAQTNITEINQDIDIETDDVEGFPDYTDYNEDNFHGLDVDPDETCENERIKNLKGVSTKNAKNCRSGCKKIKDKECSFKWYGKKKCQCKCCDKSEVKPSETEAPATKAETTKAPATKAPETKAPETKAPETKAPATEAPATKAPSTIGQGSWKSWSLWTECSKSCGFGRQVRTRSCDGMNCMGLKREFRSCNTHSCFSPGWKSWTTWSSCDRTCGGGSQTRTRQCSSASGCRGKNMDHRSCGEGSCPVDCEWRNWNEWEPCQSELCGKRPPPTKRTRSVYMEASNGGVQCQGVKEEIKQCPVTKCQGAPNSREDFGGSFVPQLENWKEDLHSVWGNTEWCKKGSWADSIKVKMAPYQGGGDDTALNGIKLQCRRKSGSRSNMISSKFGPQGSWTTSEECKGNHFVNAINFRFEGMKKKTSGKNENVDKEDSSGGNGLDFQCSDGNGYTGTSNDGFTGDWSGYQKCPAGSYVCGVQTKVKEYRKQWDNTALNTIRFFCCYDN